MGKQRGITLIALVVTIVVLLILAGVAISSIQNDGILSYAQNAAKYYNQAAANEQEILEGYVDLLNNDDSANGESTGSDNEEQETLATPTISITDNTLTITAVTNATSYDVYVGGVLKTNTTSTTLDLKTLNLEAGEYQITVMAKADGYTSSETTTEVIYTVEEDDVFSITVVVQGDTENTTVNNPGTIKAGEIASISAYTDSTDLSAAVTLVSVVGADYVENENTFVGMLDLTLSNPISDVVVTVYSGTKLAPGVTPE